MDRPMRLLQIGFDPTVQQRKSWAVQISKLHSDGQITERRIHTYPFDDVKERCCDLGLCTASKSSPQSTPHFTKVTINSQYFQAKPRRCSYRVALSYCLVESTLPRLMMLEPICLTPPHRPLTYRFFNFKKCSGSYWAQF